jgi:LacI family transcriptional regulator
VTTLFDVARRAGVSKSTVSNVIRDSAPVAASTRRRVEAAIAELGYHPNVVARSLKSRTTFALGLVVPEPTNPFYALLVLGAERAAHERGYAVLVANTECEPETEEEAIGALIGRRVDGVIIAGVSSGSRIHESLLDRGVPVVLAGFGAAGDERLGVVDTDDEGAMEQVVEHLAGLGHRRLAFVRHHLDETSGERRAAGFAAAVARRGLELVQAGAGATAIAAHNDALAIETIDRLEREGRRVPDDVSVVGFDDVPLASHQRLELTTVRSDGREIGRRAAELLIDAARAGGFVSRREVHPAVLVVRRSTGRAA